MGSLPPAAAFTLFPVGLFKESLLVDALVLLTRRRAAGSRLWSRRWGSGEGFPPPALPRPLHGALCGGDKLNLHPPPPPVSGSQMAGVGGAMETQLKHILDAVSARDLI